MDYYPEQNTQTSDVMNNGLKEYSAEQLQMLISPKEIVKDMERYLRRTVLYDADKMEWIRPPNVKPLLNEDGVNEVLNDVRYRNSKLFSLSNYDDRSRKIVCLQYARNLLKLYYGKNKQFNIEKIHIRKFVHDMVDGVDATLRRAHKGALMEAIKETSRYVETKKLGNDKSKLNPFK